MNTTQADTQPTAIVSSKNAISRRKFSMGIVIALVILILLAGCGYAFYLQHQIQQQLHFQYQAQLLQQQQTQVLEQAQQQINQLNQQIQRLQTQFQTTQLQHHARADRWLLLTARYYLELATIAAHWQNDPSTTIALLQQADHLLSQAHDARLLNIRQAIAKEIAANQQIKPIDFSGLLTRLDALQQIIATLPFKKSMALTAPSTPPSTNTALALTWRERLQKSLQQLKKLVIIQHHDEAMQPLLTPAYEMMLRENIRLNLQAAQWAVLQQNPTVYQLSLQQAQTNLKRGFDEQAPSVQQMLTQIQALSAAALIQQRLNAETALPLLNNLLTSPLSSPSEEQS